MRVTAVAVGICVAACAPLPPLRAVVDVAPTERTDTSTVLAMPTLCSADDDVLCDMSMFYTDKSKAPKLTFDEIVAPVLRLKLELAGYTIVDPQTLRLETAERTDVTNDDSTYTKVDDVPTVATLSLADAASAAQSIHLENMLLPTLHVFRDGYSVVYELIAELRAVPGGERRWTVRCHDVVDVPEESVNLVANCVGNGVLAWRAPDAAIGQVR